MDGRHARCLDASNLVSLIRMKGTRRYNIPMFGVKHWYEHEMEAVGHLASMEDAYLRRMYASKVVNGMNHLTKAIDEKVADPGYEQKKRDLELMKASVMRTMEHLKKDYDVSEGNISYKWNTGANNVTMPSSFEPSMSAPPPSFNENTLSLNVDEPVLFNENDSVLTLNNMRNFATAKTNTAMNLNSGTLNLNATTLNNANNMPTLNNANNMPTITNASNMPTLNNANNNLASLNVPSLNAPSLNVPSLNAPTLNAPSLNVPSLNVPSLNAPILNAPTLNAPSLNAPSLNAPILNNVPRLNNVTNLNNKNKNKNKNKNTLVGGRRRKHKKARHTRRK